MVSLSISNKDNILFRLKLLYNSTDHFWDREFTFLKILAITN